MSLLVTSLITIHCSRPRVHRGEDLSAQGSPHHQETKLPESFHFQTDKYKNRQIVNIPQIIILKTPFSGLVTASSPPTGGDPASLENANYHNTFSLSSEESEASSSSTPSPRHTEDMEAEAGGGRLAGLVDRLRSGVAATRGFERF